MKKYNSPLEKRNQYNSSYLSDTITMLALSGMSATSILTDLTQNMDFKLAGIPGVAILCYGFMGITGAFAVYNHGKAKKWNEKYTKNLKARLNMLSKEELKELENMLNNEEIFKLAEEVRDNNLEKLLVEREKQISKMEASNNTYTDLNSRRRYHK